MTDYERFLSPTGRHLHQSAIRQMGTVVARTEDLVSFAAGYPDSRLFPWNDFREIANELCISRKTVDTHLYRIHRKLGLRTSAELVRLASGLGLTHAGRTREGAVIASNGDGSAGQWLEEQR